MINSPGEDTLLNLEKAKQYHRALQGTAKTFFVYRCTARCLGSQKAAALPCLTQRIDHFFMFQVLYRAAPRVDIQEQSSVRITPVSQSSMALCQPLFRQLKAPSFALLISRYILRLGLAAQKQQCPRCPNPKMYLEIRKADERLFSNKRYVVRRQNQLTVKFMIAYDQFCHFNQCGMVANTTMYQDT